jgi:hypothetical protein
MKIYVSKSTRRIKWQADGSLFFDKLMTRKLKILKKCKLSELQNKFVTIFYQENSSAKNQLGKFKGNYAWSLFQ